MKIKTLAKFAKGDEIEGVTNDDYVWTEFIFSISVMIGLTLVFTPVNRADVLDFLVSASIPAANGISIVATEVDSASGNFGSTVSALDFDPMAFITQQGVWLPDHYFAIDVGVTGGAGSPNQCGHLFSRYGRVACRHPVPG